MKNKTQNEEPKSVKIMRDGVILKRNIFDTERGQYIVYNILYEGGIFFVKKLNGKVVEATIISKLGGK